MKIVDAPGESKGTSRVLSQLSFPPARHSGLHQGAHCWETAGKFFKKTLFGKNKGIKSTCYHLMRERQGERLLGCPGKAPLPWE